ncbi:MAG: alpha-glucan family phosphorylase, partial [Dehalococcoidia bacterium]
MPLKATRTFSVEPQLPLALEPLRELAYNLRWTWDVDTQRLFQDLAGGRWEALERNPVRLLQSLTSEQKERFAADEGLVARVTRARESLEAYLARPRRVPVPELTDGDVIAYFSLEFALAECLPNYSGGLGVLAGDHLKSASDLGLPLVGVGLLYRQGYFQQSLRPDGWQAEGYAENDFASQPVRPVRDASGAQLTISVPLDSREIRAAIWRVDVGQVPLFLLDADIPGNSEADRGITGTLYGGDSEMRIQQEIVVGIGGIRALSALGLRAAVCHMNEGHSALLGLERIRGLMESAGASFDEARVAVAASSIFTTHTAVAAGIDLFPPELVKLQLGEYHSALGLDVEEFLGLGRVDALDATEPFSMALLGLRLSDTRNGVSRLHRGVAQKLWSGAWPGLAPEEVPIGSVTNGVHLPTWVSPEMAGVYDRHLGPEWRDNPGREGLWEPVAHIPPHELWGAHESARNRMLERARAAARYSAVRATDQHQPGGLRDLLQPGVLTVGFARRFATYKRAALLFQNPERLARLVQNPERPIQFIFAGKAHPRDDAGKQLIREVVHFSLQPEFRNRILFVEKYDVGLARDLVQGCDIWLNTPLRPLEASGTSGMKAVANGTLHMSVMDGWWHEAYVPGAGWAIGRNAIDDDPELQDAFDAESVYDLLEDEALPLFYDKDPQSGLPLGWLSAVARSIREYAPVYTTDRMVTEYAQAGYEPSAAAWNALVMDNLARARSLAAWKQ